jgi:hypothetical protein
LNQGLTIIISINYNFTQQTFRLGPTTIFNDDSNFALLSPSGEEPHPKFIVNTFDN